MPARILAPGAERTGTAHDPRVAAPTGLRGLESPHRVRHAARCGRYLASVSTFYRLLRTSGETRGRRNELTHPAYAKPELLATSPSELWSWDITKLKGPSTWTCFHLYVILDVYSRYVVGWMIALRESAELAQALIAETCTRKA